MPTLLDGITSGGSLLGFLTAGPGSDAPTTADALDRIRASLLPHQLAFCDDTEHRKLGLVCGDRKSTRLNSSHRT